MTVSQAPFLKFRGVDNNGNSASGGLLFTYAAGSSTKLATFTDASGSTPNTNPIILNSRGECDIFLTSNLLYKFVLSPSTDTDPPTNAFWTEDNIAGNASAVTLSSLSANSVTSASLAASSGATLIGWIQSVAGAVLRTISDKLTDQVSIFDFMTTAQINDVRNGTALIDLSTQLQTAQTWLSGLTTPKRKLIFPAGIYSYSVSPNWAINHARILAAGEVRLRYTGVGNAVIIDAGSGAQNIYDVTFGSADSPFIIECPSTSAHACFVRACHHSNIAVKPRGSGTSSAGLLVNFSVATKFWVTCSVNEDGGWYTGAKPAYGINLSQRGAGEQVSYCQFYTTIIEGPSQGIYLDRANGNTFFGGTSEGCTNQGVFESSNCIGNKFIGFDFEVNTNADVDAQGLQTEFEGCDSNKLITLRGNDQLIHGGVHSKITIAATSTFARLRDMRYNRLNDGSTITDSGNLTTKENVVNYGTGILDAEQIPNLTSYGTAVSSPTAGASPWTYHNTNSYPVEFIAAGGTISNIQFSRDNVTYYSVTGTTNGGAIRLSPGDYSKVTYSSIPVITVVPM